MGGADSSNAAYFATRLPYDPRRDRLWQALLRFHFSALIAPQDCVLELGAGYGHFINQVKARRRIAVDQWPGIAAHAAAGVEAHVGDVTDLSFLERGSVNFVFASNVFEHVPQEALRSVLVQLKEALAPGGTVTILQPNYRYCAREYFDDYTHRTVYSHVSLGDVLESEGYDVFECRPRFLPLTLKSKWPVSAALVRLYLAMPVKPFGKQMLLRARPRTAHSVHSNAAQERKVN